jgi:RND family efflux transporter MFP subunit
MDGVVLARYVEPGEVAMVNSPLLKIGTVENLILECAIDEADIGKVATGKKVAVSLYAFPQAVAKGEIFEILPDADRVKKAFLAKIRFVDPPSGLRSGMTAEANVVIEQHPGALLVPAEAVDSAGALFLLVDGRVHHLTPRLGVRDMLRVEVLEGLHEGDQVVVGGAGVLEDGRRVQPTVKPPFDGVAPSSVTRSKMSL